MRLGEVSFWYRDLGGLPPQRAPLDGDTSVDVCIVGAGYTGLWTAYYLKKLDPGLNILIVEKEFAGYGASGRNGGWLTGGFSWKFQRYGQNVGDLVRALKGTVDEILRVASEESIDADILRTEELTIAVNDAQISRMRDEIKERQKFGETDIYELNASQARQRVNIPNLMGAMVTPGVARIQPAKLVTGLAACVERAGVRIVEGTTAVSLTKGYVHTDKGRVGAGAIIRATEGYTADLQQSPREWLPLNSAQIVTAPLSDAIWQEIGWNGRELIGDFANVYCYCQCTREGRLTIGSRGVPYLYGSRTDSDGAPDGVTIDRLKNILRQYFPSASKLEIDHAWCGVLGVPRDWCATVGMDAESRIGWAGGYVGVGVSTSNLVGRTLADLTLGRKTELTELPWVNRRVREWEREPLRWLGVRGM